MAPPRITAELADRTGSPNVNAPEAPDTPPALWDPIVRLTHWGIAAAVLINALVTKGGSVAHVSIGWVAMALLLLRLIWGGLGPAEARFSAFRPDLPAAVRHLRVMLSGERPRNYRSHNPAGALMVYAFWLALAVVIASGLVMTSGATPMEVAADTAAVESGDWSALIRGDGAEVASDWGGLVEEVHEVAANLLLILAALHVAGVFIEGRLMRRNLLAPMIAGSRPVRRK